MIASRRSFLLGAGALLAAPSIVRVASLMPVSFLEKPKPCIQYPVPYESRLGMWMDRGEPNFVAEHGSLYLRTDDPVLYVNTGGNSWFPIRSESHA